MADQITDIVMTTRNRLGYLERSVAAIRERTRAPYALHIIDDGSDDEKTVPWLLKQSERGWFASLVLRRDKAGIMANKNLSTFLALSDPFVITADDILCPDLEPCWLARGLRTLKDHPEIGELDLDHPGAYRVALRVLPDVTYCEVVGGTFGFVRRAAVEGWNLPHYRDNFGQGDDVFRSGHIRESGLQVAFMNDVHCYHFGEWSELHQGRYPGAFVEPKDWKTLEPKGGTWWEN